MEINLNPHQISEARIILAEEYSKYSGELAKLIKLHADYFNENRKNHKSDTSVERAFEATELGVQMTIVKLKLKAIEKKLSAYNTHLRLLENEANNIY